MRAFNQFWLIAIMCVGTLQVSAERTPLAKSSWSCLLPDGAAPETATGALNLLEGPRLPHHATEKEFDVSSFQAFVTRGGYRYISDADFTLDGCDSVKVEWITGYSGERIGRVFYGVNPTGEVGGDKFFLVGHLLSQGVSCDSGPPMRRHPSGGNLAGEMPSTDWPEPASPLMSTPSDGGASFGLDDEEPLTK